jgi:diguanylate cyclase (GGDEF)-like protein
MKRMRLGLHGKFLAILLASTLAWLAVVAVIWRAGSQAIDGMRRESEAAFVEQSRSTLADRGAQLAGLLSIGLANPLYYFDLQQVREAVAPALAQPDVIYVRVYDAAGRLVHDGSPDIEGFGQPMSDPLAAEIIAAQKPLVLWSEDLVDASAPIAIGEERLGGVRVGLSLARIGEAVARERSAADRRYAEAFAGPAHLLYLGLFLLGVWFVAAMVFVARGLVSPIRALARHAGAIERGLPVATLDSRRQDELGELIRAFGRMSEAVRRHEQDIRRLAYYDSLTGLANRLRFREVLEASLAGSQPAPPLALLFVDFDDFKRINDTVGHDAGDRALIECARRLEQALGVREHQTFPFLARLGGDEFVVLLSAADSAEARAQAIHAAEAILAVMREPIDVVGHRVRLGASIGITLHPEDARNPALLVKYGDLAMYEAKREGKGSYRFYTRELIEVAEERLGLEHALREALERSELTLAYQPILGTPGGRPAGFEALLRWRSPLRGDVPPSVFVPVAEATGLIHALGSFALDHAVGDCAAWQSRWPKVPVAVNLSPRQLRQPDIVEQVQAVLRRHGLPPDCLHLELTESSLLHDEARAIEVLGQLRATGVRLWLDDFGTGFSGLSHLRRFRVDGVKIDRSFVGDILTDPDDLALASAVIAMAKSLGMQVIAEGVETEAQLGLLVERGCDLVQGFLFSEPAAIDEMPRRLARSALAAAAREVAAG